MNFSVVILAGGESRRMGRDKAWVEADGRPLIAHALSTVRELGLQEMFVSGRAGTDYSHLRCPVLFDLEPGYGPLGGIERALHAAVSPLLLVLAVDLPNMTTAFLQNLMKRCDHLTGAVPKLKGELEPLVAVYPKRCHVIARDCLLNGRRAAREFAEACLRERAVRAFAVTPGDMACFANWNSPADVAVECQPNQRQSMAKQVPGQSWGSRPARLRKWLPVVAASLCTGCNACVEACGPKSLELVNNVAVLAWPDTCGSEEHCIAPCPTGAIQMAWLEHEGNLNRGKWRIGRASVLASPGGGEVWARGDARPPVNSGKWCKDTKAQIRNR